MQLTMNMRQTVAIFLICDWLSLYFHIPTEFHCNGESSRTQDFVNGAFASTNQASKVLNTLHGKIQIESAERGWWRRDS